MGWKIGGAISAIRAVVAALVTLTTASEYKTGIEWVIAVIFAVLAILCFWRAIKAGAAKKAKLAANQTFMTDQDLEQIQGGGLPVLADVPVILAGWGQCPRGEGRVSQNWRRRKPDSI